MIELLRTLILNDLFIGVGYAIGTILIGIFTIVGGWRKHIKPFLETKIIKPLTETNDQVNHGRFSAMKNDVHDMKEDVYYLKTSVSHLKSEVRELKEGQAATKAKLDTIIEYTKGD